MDKKPRDPVLFRRKEKPDPFNRAGLDTPEEETPLQKEVKRMRKIADEQDDYSGGYGEDF